MPAPITQTLARVSRVSGGRSGVSLVAIQTGTPITATSAAVARAPICGLPIRHGAGLAERVRSTAAGESATPSKRRIAASIAASRRSGRGGGVSGNDAERSLSVAIHHAPSAERIMRQSGRSLKQGDERDICRPYSLNCGLVECAIARDHAGATSAAPAFRPSAAAGRSPRPTSPRGRAGRTRCDSRNHPRRASP